MSSNPIRKEPRVSAVLPVRIYGMDSNGKAFNSVAHTLNVSKSGALLANIDIALSIGDLIGVQKGIYKGKFRVRWIGQKGTVSHGQLGIECVEGAKNIWNVDDRPHSITTEATLAQRRNRPDLPEEPQQRGERRLSPRHACDIGVQIREEPSLVNLWARCTDLSEGGCYIDTRAPSPSGTKLHLTIFLDPDQFAVDAVVRTYFPGMGMGLQFEFESDEQKGILRRYIRQTFGAPEVRENSPAAPELPDLQALCHMLDDLKHWAAHAALSDSDREEIEAFAVDLRREVQGLRATLYERILHRQSAPVSK